MSNYVNMAVPVVYKGQHYKGISIQPGVSFSVTEAPCVASKHIIVWDNAKVDVKVFLEGISSVEEHDSAVKEYLLVTKA